VERFNRVDMSRSYAWVCFPIYPWKLPVCSRTNRGVRRKYKENWVTPGCLCEAQRQSFYHSTPLLVRSRSGGVFIMVFTFKDDVARSRDSKSLRPALFLTETRPAATTEAYAGSADGLHCGEKACLLAPHGIKHR
jgi:hypothetical protein